MGALVGFLTDSWLTRCGVKDPLRLIVAVVGAVVVIILTDTGSLAHF